MSQGAVIEIHLRIEISNVQDMRTAILLAQGIDSALHYTAWSFDGVEKVDVTHSAELAEIED